jgi:hypothetical protein
LDSPVGKWQIVILRPPAHVVAVAPGPAIAVGSSSVGLLEEHLVLTPKVLLEHHALDMRALLHQPLRRTKICPIELRVMDEFTLTEGPIMKRLSCGVIGDPVRLQKLSSPVRERHQIAASLAID